MTPHLSGVELMVRRAWRERPGRYATLGYGNGNAAVAFVQELTSVPPASQDVMQ